MDDIGVHALDVQPLTPSMGITVSGTRMALDALPPSVLKVWLRKHGAVLFAGFGDSLNQFERLTSAISDELIVHHNLSREFINSDGTIQTVTPGCGLVAAHVERGYIPPVPHLVCFYCKVSAATGGETTLYDGFDVYQAMNDSLARFFSTTRMRWSLDIPRVMWERALQTTDADHASATLERHLRAYLDPSADEVADLHFVGSSLSIRFELPWIRQSSRKQGSLFANSLLSFLEGLQSGDFSRETLTTTAGQPIPSAALDDVMACCEQVAVPVKWSTGDFLCVDNRSIMHGRRPFSDQRRRVLIRLAFSNGLFATH